MPSTGRTIAYTILGLIAAGLLAFGGLVAYYLWQIKYHPELVKEPIPPVRSGQFTSDPKRKSAKSDEQFINSSAYIRSYSPSIGSSAAPVTILAFIDFECPFCQKSYPITKATWERFAPVIRVVFKHLPVETLHSHALPSALASACAREQNKFWPYYDILFRTKKLDDASLLSAAGELKLNEALFIKCITSEKTQSQIDQDLVDAAELGLRGTPTYFVNGRRIEGVISEQEWSKIILEELKKK